MVAKDDCSQDEKLTTALRDIAVLTERLANQGDALRLQASEYERRLKDLNHAHEQARVKEADFLRHDVYEKSENDRHIWQRDVDADLTALKTRRDSNLAMIGTALSLLSLALWAFSIFWSHM